MTVTIEPADRSESETLVDLLLAQNLYQRAGFRRHTRSRWVKPL